MRIQFVDVFPIYAQSLLNSLCARARTEFRENVHNVVCRERRIGITSFRKFIGLPFKVVNRLTDFKDAGNASLMFSEECSGGEQKEGQVLEKKKIVIIKPYKRYWTFRSVIASRT